MTVFGQFTDPSKFTDVYIVVSYNKIHKHKLTKCWFYCSFFTQCWMLIVSSSAYFSRICNIEESSKVDIATLFLFGDYCFEGVCYQNHAKTEILFESPYILLQYVSLKCPPEVNMYQYSYNIVITVLNGFCY